MSGITVKMPSGFALWAIEALIPYEKNARTHDEAQITEIAASILELGFNDPIAVDEKDGILEGHGRLLAARELGLLEVPVIVLSHLSPAQKAAYRVAHNKLALKAGWDDDLLREELKMVATDGLEATLTGFTDAEIEALLDDEDDDGEDNDKPRGSGNPQISYTIVFDSEEQQRDWFRFMRFLRRQNPGEDLTFAQRLTDHVAPFIEREDDEPDDDADAA